MREGEKYDSIDEERVRHVKVELERMDRNRQQDKLFSLLLHYHIFCCLYCLPCLCCLMNLIENVERGAELCLILLLLVSFADPSSSEIDVSDRTDRRTDGRTVGINILWALLVLKNLVRNQLTR